MKTYLVRETFGPTIQGEGKGTGSVVMFLRFSGCNKWSGRPQDKATSACPFCDTDFVGGRKLTADEIIQELAEKGSNVRELVISGGEPTLQLDQELLEKLYFCGYKITVETNGSRALSEGVENEILTRGHYISCSPKQIPSETKIQVISGLKVLHPPVTPDRHIERFLDAFEDSMVDFYVQPVMDENYNQNLKECLELCYKHPKVKLSVQIHKTIGVE